MFGIRECVQICKYVKKLQLFIIIKTTNTKYVKRNNSMYNLVLGFLCLSFNLI